MKRALIVAVALACIVASPVAGRAQTKPSFAGTWTLDLSKSDPAPAQMGGGMRPGAGDRTGPGGVNRGGGAGGGGMMGGPAASMTIAQTPTELSIQRAMGQRSQTAVYKLDGSESVNAMGMGDATSKASWDGSALVVTTVQTMQGRGGDMTIESKEIYSLEGGALTVLTTRKTPMGAQTRKLVYTKS